MLKTLRLIIGLVISGGLFIFLGGCTLALIVIFYFHPEE
jgi:hypothetical protein